MDKLLSFKNLTKSEKIDVFKRLGIIILGNLILAFGTAVFLIQCDIVAGGLGGLGIIFKNVFNWDEDITILVLQWALFFLGLLFLGKKFAIETLVATIVYPLGIILFTRVISPSNLPLFRLVDANGNISETSMLIAGLFGGLLSGIGVALNMVGGGSTGGVDILAILLRKITRIKTSIWVFSIDALIIIAGMIFAPHSDAALLYGLIGMLSAFTCSLVIEIVFSKQNNCYIANIISSKWEIINKYIQDDMKRGATIIPVQGGYQFNEYRMIQVAFSRKEQNDLLIFVAHSDPSAFVTIVHAHEINGEGFRNLPQKRKKQMKAGKKNESGKLRKENPKE